MRPACRWVQPWPPTTTKMRRGQTDRPRGPGRILAAARRHQLRLGVVSDAAQARRALRLPHHRPRAAHPRRDAGTVHGRRAAGNRRRPGRRDDSTRIPIHPLMGLFAASLQDLGDRVQREFGGSFSAAGRLGRRLGGDAGPAARRLGIVCRLLAATRSSSCPSSSGPRSPPPTCNEPAVASFTDFDRLTMFADNLVPHVLRLDGVLRFDPELVARIERRGADRARQSRGGRDPRLRTARGRAARRRPRATPAPRTSTSCCGSGADSRATRPCRATAAAAPPTDDRLLARCRARRPRRASARSPPLRPPRPAAPGAACRWR